MAEESLSTLGVSRQHWSSNVLRSQMGSGEEALQLSLQLCTLQGQCNLKSGWRLTDEQVCSEDTGSEKAPQIGVNIWVRNNVFLLQKIIYEYWNILKYGTISVCSGKEITSYNLFLLLLTFKFFKIVFLIEWFFKLYNLQFSKNFTHMIPYNPIVTFWFSFLILQSPYCPSLLPSSHL